MWGAARCQQHPPTTWEPGIPRDSALVLLSQPAGPENICLGHAGGLYSEQAVRKKASMKIRNRRTQTTTWLRVLLSQDPWYFFQGLVTHCVYRDNPATEMKCNQEAEVLLHMFYPSVSPSLWLHACLCAKWRFTDLLEDWSHLLTVSNVQRKRRAFPGHQLFPPAGGKRFM